jgi:porin
MDSDFDPHGIGNRRGTKVTRRPVWLAVAVMAAHPLAEQTAHAQAGVASPSAPDSLRKRLEKRGIGFGLRYGGEAFSEVSGGLRRGTTYLGNANLQLTLDAQRLIGWPGLTLFLYELGIHGGRPSTFAGDAQGVSNIEGAAKWTLEEAWIQQNLFGDRFSALVGRYDLNSEFYRLQSAGLFLNSSFGVGPEFSQSGQEGPSIFPDTSVGARFGFKPVKEIVLRAAVLDGVPVDRPDGGRRIFAKGDGLLVVGEVAYLRRPVGSEQPRSTRFRIGRGCCGPYAGKFALGAWYYTATFDGLADRGSDGRPLRYRGSGGVYLLADQVVHQEADRPERRLTVFGELGIGDPRVNRFAHYTGGGITASALIPGRAQDELGIAVAAARNGSQFIATRREQGMRASGSEVTLELTYLAQLASRLAAQPDLQLVMNPDTDPRARNAVAFLLRFELSF